MIIIFLCDFKASTAFAHLLPVFIYGKACFSYETAFGNGEFPLLKWRCRQWLENVLSHSIFQKHKIPWSINHWMCCPPRSLPTLSHISSLDTWNCGACALTTCLQRSNLEPHLFNSYSAEDCSFYTFMPSTLMHTLL